MNLFGLEGSGFVLAIGLTLLIGGLITFYCNVKFRSIENKIETQKNVLQSFISQTSSLLTTDEKTNTGDLSSSTATRVASSYYDNKPFPKVDVSDNEDDEESDDSDGTSSNEENTTDSSDDDLSEDDDEMSATGKNSNDGDGDGDGDDSGNTTINDVKTLHVYDLMNDQL